MTPHPPAPAANSLSRDQARELDRLAEEELGLPGIVLMENAAINAAAAVLDHLEQVWGLEAGEARVGLICGGGNNGGDGYALARHLHNWGVAVTLYPVREPEMLKGDASINQRVCGRMGLPHRLIRQPHDLEREATGAGGWEGADTLVDAVLGTGFQGEVREPSATILSRINAASHPSVVSLDTPSGLDCETGRAARATVRADLTITFAALKAGFTREDAPAYLGRVCVAEIGTPPQLLTRVAGDND